ncbi:hypothetical protein AB0L49_23585 [Streptomyces antimycoticus]|uniref:hypothetical protein n=1 Tax=Streptomyces antimycoticus TaxID=68175 RepID=UPI00341B18F4
MSALPPTRDAADYACTYAAVLGWPVARGHRYRPRSGCTCLDGSTAEICPTPGAHPIDSSVVVVSSPDRLQAEFAAAPGAGVIAPTLQFDAVVLPRPVAMFALVLAEREGPPVPCVNDRHRSALLVAPGTARAVLSTFSRTVVKVRSGPDQWVALPPSHGTRWDTPPWDEMTGEPVTLPDAAALSQPLTLAIKGVR